MDKTKLDEDKRTAEITLANEDAKRQATANSEQISRLLESNKVYSY